MKGSQALFVLRYQSMKEYRGRGNFHTLYTTALEGASDENQAPSFLYQNK
jgi:hypothetical protein